MNSVANEFEAEGCSGKTVLINTICSCVANKPKDYKEFQEICNRAMAIGSEHPDPYRDAQGNIIQLTEAEQTEWDNYIAKK